MVKNESVPAQFCSRGLLSIVRRLGLVNDNDLENLPKQHPTRMLISALCQGDLDRSELLPMIARAINIPYLDTREANILRHLQKDNLLHLLDCADAAKYRYFPLSRRDGEIVTLFADPLDTETISRLSFSWGARVSAHLADEEDILNALNKVLTIQAIEKAVSGDPAFSSPLPSEGDLDASSPDSTGASSNSESMIKLVNEMIAAACYAGASDIHIEPNKDGLEVRFRQDGVLRNYLSLSKRLQPYITCRIKLLGRMDIAEKRKPQDGRFRFNASAEAAADIRISSVPTPFGEKLALRLLISNERSWSFAALGFEPSQETELRSILEMRDRLFVVTGPTGSGKSTTLYTAVHSLRNQTNNIITVEDPIEYRLEGITQIQVDEARGVTFSSGLRSILRQDPDVILVGEIRDQETLNCAIQAAQTGHQVLSSLHTNSAPSAITRFIDLGASPLALSSALGAVLAQRLVRRLCGSCAIPLAAGELEKYNLPPFFKTAHVMSAQGCELCEGTGYRGRVALISLLLVTDPIRQLIRSRASEEEIGRAAKPSGFCSILDDGLAKVEQGMTSFEELHRVLGAEVTALIRTTKENPQTQATEQPRKLTVEQLKKSFIPLVAHSSSL